MNARLKHTPAPWHVDDIDNYQGFDHLVGAAIVCDAHMIAEIRGATEIDGRVHEEHAANARLIAAAPELLAALKGLVEHFAEQLCMCGEPDCRATEARAAIAKAEGRRS